MLILLTAATLMADPGAAQQQDLRCVAAIAAAGGTMEPGKAATLAPLATYYIGRVTGRDPAVDLEAEITRELTDEAAFLAALPTELQRCGNEMQSVGEKLQQIGQALKRKAAARGK